MILSNTFVKFVLKIYIKYFKNYFKIKVNSSIIWIFKALGEYTPQECKLYSYCENNLLRIIVSYKQRDGGLEKELFIEALDAKCIAKDFQLLDDGTVNANCKFK